MMKRGKLIRIRFPVKQPAQVKYTPMDEHEMPKHIPSRHSPFPLPTYDTDFGFGPTSIRQESLPLGHASSSPIGEIDCAIVDKNQPSMMESHAQVHDSIKASGTSEAMQKQAFSKDRPSTKATGWHNFPVFEPRDNRLSRIERTSDHPQIGRYRSALSPLNLIREWKTCMIHDFQNTHSIFLRADILSKLPDFSNQEIGEVLHLMTVRHEAGKPFYTRKREKKPISITYDLVVPEASMHQSHFSFLAEIEEFLVSKQVHRLVDDPKFLATAMRSFAHLRCDDSTSDFERFTTRNPSTYNTTSRAYMREDTFVSWHRPCGEDLFRVGQAIAASRIDRFALSDLVKILGAAMVVRQFADGTLVDAAVSHTLKCLDACQNIPIDIGPGPQYAERYAKYKHVKQTIQAACQIFLVLTLGGVWNEKLAQSVIHHALNYPGHIKHLEISLSRRPVDGRQKMPLDDRLEHVRAKIDVFRPPSEVFLALSSMFPLQVDAFLKVWRSIRDEHRTVSDYKYLHDLLMREVNPEQRRRIIEETVQSLDVLDRVLLKALPFFGKSFVCEEMQGFTSDAVTHFIKRTANSVRFLDASCFLPVCRKEFIAHEMDLQATGGIVPIICYSSLRAIQDRTQHVTKLLASTKWALSIVQEEVQKGTIRLILPSDEIALCRESYGNDSMMPLYAIRYMTEQLPLVEPYIVSRSHSHHKQDAFPLFEESGQKSPQGGGQEEIASTFFTEHRPVKRIIKVESPKSVTHSAVLGYYNEWVDEKLRGILHNERRVYKRSHNLDYKEIVTERPGFHSFIHDARRAGYAPQNEDS